MFHFLCITRFPITARYVSSILFVGRACPVRIWMHALRNLFMASRSTKAAESIVRNAFLTNSQLCFRNPWTNLSEPLDSTSCFAPCLNALSTWCQYQRGRCGLVASCETNGSCPRNSANSFKVNLRCSQWWIHDYIARNLINIHDCAVGEVGNDMCSIRQTRVWRTHRYLCDVLGAMTEGAQQGVVA